LLLGPVGEPVELLSEYFWRAPDGEHLCGSSVRGAPFWGFGRMWEEGSGDGHHLMGVH